MSKMAKQGRSSALEGGMAAVLIDALQQKPSKVKADHASENAGRVSRRPGATLSALRHVQTNANPEERVRVALSELGLYGEIVNDLQTYAAQNNLRRAIVILEARPKESASTSLSLEQAIREESEAIRDVPLKSDAVASMRTAIADLKKDEAFWIGAKELASTLGSESINPYAFLQHKRESGTLPFAKSANKFLYPSVAVSPREPRLNHWLSLFHKALPEDKRGWTFMVWLSRHSSQLAGRSPHELLSEAEDPSPALARYAGRFAHGLEA